MAFYGGTPGDDILMGGADDDVLWGGRGDDRLSGGGGNDRLEGGPGADALDGGLGTDIAEYTSSDAGVTVDLTLGTARGGHAEGDTLTSIESVRGSHHADMLTARAESSTLWGNKGDDTLIGGPGADILGGGKGADTLEGGAGNDQLTGGAGADVLDGGAGGGDIANYWLSDAGVTVDLATGTARGGHAEGDTLTSIESVRGSHHADMLTARAEGSTLWGNKGDDTLIGGPGADILGGGKGADTLEGGAGNDHLTGGAGADVLDGGTGGGDIANYWRSDAGVTVDLAMGTARGGHAEGDTLSGIENVGGSDHADRLSGDDWNNRLIGAAGNDTLEGGAGNDQLQGRAGADVLDGGAGGGDIANYWGSDAGVTVDLAMGTGRGGYAEGDTLSGIENVWGSDHADRLSGDDRNNGLVGAAGNDTLDGGAGNDWLQGRAGADVLDGGAGGGDRASYWGSDAGVTVDLAMGAARGGHAEGDTLTGIENLRGSDHADVLVGDDRNNRLVGAAGNDTLGGGAGNDYLDGQTGEDLLTGGEGADTFVFGDGDTVTDFQDATDRIDLGDFGHINADNFETSVTIRQSGSDVEVRIGDAVLTLTEASAADITVDDFVVFA